MAFTMIGYFENQDSAVLILTAALADQHVRVDGDDVIVPKLNKIAFVYAWGADITLGQLSSPSLRRETLFDVQPIDDGADEPTSNPPVVDLWENPIPLDVSEALNFLGAEDNGGAGDMACFVWLMDEITPVPDGKVFTVRATNTTTLVIDTWTNGELTFSQTLPAGRYSVVGMRAQSAGLRAARLVPIGGTWRPGVIGFDAAEDVEPERFRMGRAGEFLQFEHDTPPSVDFMSLSADTAQVVHLDLIQVRSGKP